MQHHPLRSVLEILPNKRCVNIGVLLDLHREIDERNYNGDTANELTNGPQVLNSRSHSLRL